MYFQPFAVLEGCGRLCMRGIFPLALGHTVQPIRWALALLRKGYSIYERKGLLFCFAPMSGSPPWQICQLL